MDKPKVRKVKKVKVKKAKKTQKQTQTQSQKVIVNLSDALKRKPSRRTSTKPSQPQII